MDPGAWSRLKDVVAEAAKRAPSDRERFVRERCPNPHDRDAVLAVLAAQAETEASDPASGPAPRAAVELGPGTRVGPYVILDSIGRGGMGEVFLGSDPRLRRRVALKCLTTGSIPPGGRRDQILHEARAAAAINHPHVATIHDVIEQDGRAFIVMEYVEGETLAARLRRERLSVDEVVAIGRQLASALAAAHARGVVHRDLKPPNVQLTPHGIVKVLDFGIANAVRTLSTIGSAATTIRALADDRIGLHQPGTPPYMSPEQLLDRPVDERSDIFSLGLVLFEMAAGRRPFTDTDPAALLRAHSEGAPRADAVEPRVPKPLADVIARALAVDVRGRYQSAAELERALAAVATALAAPRHTRREMMRLFASRAAVAVPIAIVLLGVIGFTATMGFNTTFGRDGSNARFGAEPWSAAVVWGAKAVFPSLVIMTMAAIAAAGLRFVLSILVRMPPLAAVYGSARRRAIGAVQAAGLDHPSALAQILCVLGVLTIAAILTFHKDLVNAWTGLFNTSDLARLMPMRESSADRLQYRVELDVATLAFTFGLVQTLRLRRARATRGGLGPIALLAAVVAVLVLLNEWPYRIFSHRDFERVVYAGSRCYITGESGDELLVLCPNAAPPRNRVVKRADPALQRTGTIENVFRGIDAAQPGR